MLVRLRGDRSDVAEELVRLSGIAKDAQLDRITVIALEPVPVDAEVLARPARAGREELVERIGQAQPPVDAPCDKRLPDRKRKAHGGLEELRVGPQRRQDDGVRGCRPASAPRRRRRTSSARSCVSTPSAPAVDEGDRAHCRAVEPPVAEGESQWHVLDPTHEGDFRPPGSGRKNAWTPATSGRDRTTVRKYSRTGSSRSQETDSHRARTSSSASGSSLAPSQWLSQVGSSPDANEWPAKRATAGSAVHR